MFITSVWLFHFYQEDHFPYIYYLKEKALIKTVSDVMAQERWKSNLVNCNFINVLLHPFSVPSRN